MAVLCLAVASSGCFGGGLFGGGGPGPKDFVSDDRYTKWVIEVDTVEGQAPPAGVLDFVKGRLTSVVSKPDGIEVRVDQTLPARGGSWSQKDLLDYSAANFQASTSGKTAAIHLLFVDGSYDKGNVLGATFSRERAGEVVQTGPIVVFSDAIRNGCALLCLDESVPQFQAVLTHEFGHAIGLVDNGIEMVSPHEAATCQGNPDEGHSTSTRSVMHCDVETTGIFNIAGGPPTDFDADDRADLCAAGGRCG